MKIPIKKEIQDIVMRLFLFMVEILVQKYPNLKIIKSFSYRMPNFLFPKGKKQNHRKSDGFE